MKQGLSFNKILMVCVGNICRSPMAEALLQHRFPGLQISSAGIHALVDQPADPHTLELLKEKTNIDHSAHRARQLTNDLANEAALIMVMETGHIKEALHQIPTARGKIHLLGKWNNLEIQDPYRQQKTAFAFAFEQIEECLDQWQAKIWNT